MVFLKNPLLLVIAVLITVSVNAEMVGGQGRQRLSLLLFDILNTTLERNPITINKQQFPLVLADAVENRQKLKLYDVLVEEGFLKKTYRTERIEKDDLLITRVVEYCLTSKKMDEDIVVGLIVPIKMTSMHLSDTSVEGEPHYQVTFTWQFKKPAPWIWAPDLSDNIELTYLKSAIESPHSADAEFRWRDNRWRLTAIPDFFSSQ